MLVGLGPTIMGEEAATMENELNFSKELEGTALQTLTMELKGHSVEEVTLEELKLTGDDVDIEQSALEVEVLELVVKLHA